MNGAGFTPTDDVRDTQCRAVLSALCNGPQGTAALIGLGILAPAHGILDLKRAGHRIETVRVGRQGVYVLHQEVTA